MLYAIWILLLLSGCATAPEADAPRFISVSEAASLPGITRAGFDVDDTLLFSTPAFAVGQASGHAYGELAYWQVVNRSDRGRSSVKQATATIVSHYQQRGIEIFAITARNGAGGDGLQQYLEEVLGIPAANVYFEPDSKSERIRQLGLDVFFGDADSDIKDAQAVGVRAIRIQRSPLSSYRNRDGTPRKYQPGLHGEEIVADSTD
jgi:acid phosphatase (class B)